MLYFFLAVYLLVGLVNLRYQWWRSLLFELNDRAEYVIYHSIEVYKTKLIPPEVACANVIFWPWIIVWPLLQVLYFFGWVLSIFFGAACIRAVGLKLE